MPEGVYLTGMKQTGSRVEIRGIAQSSTRVSALMRQIDASEWMSDPDVDKVETTQSGASRQAAFVLYLKQVSKGDDMEEEA
jgi:type IV pilus assembly protein PilN